MKEKCKELKITEVSAIETCFLISKLSCFFLTKRGKFSFHKDMVGVVLVYWGIDNKRV